LVNENTVISIVGLSAFSILACLPSQENLAFETVLLGDWRYAAEHSGVSHAHKLLLSVVRLVELLVSLETSVLDENLGEDDSDETEPTADDHLALECGGQQAA